MTRFKINFRAFKNRWVKSLKKFIVNFRLRSGPYIIVKINLLVFAGVLLV